LGFIDQIGSAIASGFGDLAGVDVRLLALALVFQFLTFTMRATAWRNVLKAAYPAERVRLVDVGSATACGMAANGIFPAHAGNPLKVFLVRARVPNSGMPAIAATLGVTALFDVFAGALGLGIAIYLDALPHVPLVSPSQRSVAIGVALLALAAFVLWLSRHRLRGALSSLRGDIRTAATVLRSPTRYVVEVAFFQTLAWIARIALIFCMLQAFHIPASVGDAVLLVVVGGIVGALPAAPGGAGSQQIAVVFVLSGVASASAAITFSVGMQVAITIFNVTLGVIAAGLLFGTARPHLMLRRGRAAMAEAKAVEVAAVTVVADVAHAAVDALTPAALAPAPAPAPVPAVAPASTAPPAP
jgi:uncharacterized membrane protein YbhN (UPF0104 family)